MFLLVAADPGSPKQRCKTAAVVGWHASDFDTDWLRV